MSSTQPTDDHYGKVEALSDALSMNLVGEIGDCDSPIERERRAQSGAERVSQSVSPL